MTNTLNPISEPYSADVAAIISHYPRIDGYLLDLFRTFANSLRFLEKGVPNLLDTASPLPLRIREIVILRITANKNCEYEWGVHVTVFSEAAALTAHQIAATRESKINPEIWTTEEENLIQAIDQLCATGIISNNILRGFESHWTVEQQLEIFALCGTYHTISFVANCAQLSPEPFAARFP